MPSPADPIVHRLTSLVAELGDDVSTDDRGDGIAFSRSQLFALLERPAPPLVELSLALPRAAETERLRPVERGVLTHRVSLAHEDEIDAELTGWLREAYAGSTR